MGKKVISKFVLTVSPDVVKVENENASTLPRPDGTGVVFVDKTGKMVVRSIAEEFRPYPSEFKRVIELLLTYHPTCDAAQRIHAIASGRRHEQYVEEVCKYIPFVFAWAVSQGIGGENRDKFILWTLANYWYVYGGGPKPTQTKVSNKQRTAKKARRDVSWRENLACPVCNKLFITKAKVREDGVREFGVWLSSHAMVCQRRLTDEQAERVHNAVEHKYQERDKRFQSYIRKLELEEDPALVAAKKELRRLRHLLKLEYAREEQDIPTIKSLERQIETTIGLVNKWVVESAQTSAQDWSERYRNYILEHEAGTQAAEERKASKSRKKK